MVKKEHLLLLTRAKEEKKISASAIKLQSKDN